MLLVSSLSSELELSQDSARVGLDDDDPTIDKESALVVLLKTLASEAPGSMLDKLRVLLFSDMEKLEVVVEVAEPNE